MSRLKDKVALISGASSGIGAGTAEHFASLGCAVALSGRNVTRLDAVAKKCCESGLSKDKVLNIVGDLAEEESVKAAVSKTLEHFGRLDVLINNAGIVKLGSAEKTPLAVYDEIMAINLRSAFYMTQLAIPHLRKTKGCIVNVSSIAGLRALPDAVAYSISKGGMNQLTTTTALELAADGVRVNAVNPGVIDIKIRTRPGISEEKYNKVLEHSKTTHPMGRIGEVGEVAKTIAFLASDDASFITGQTLAIDGGRTATCPH